MPSTIVINGIPKPIVQQDKKAEIKHFKLVLNINIFFPIDPKLVKIPHIINKTIKTS